jgi:tetratricopeptide (TPR) repeat protein
MSQNSEEKYITAAVRDPQLMAAALALYENRLHDAEPVLKARLKHDPYDVAAMRMLAELAGRIGRFHDAENLLQRAVELSPRWTPARSNLAMVLYRQGRSSEAIAVLDRLIEDEPEHLGHANLKAAAAGRIGDYQEAVRLYETVLQSNPNVEKTWMSYGHVLKTVGRRKDSIAAYRRALAIKPGFGEVWWSLANLKTVKFEPDDLTVMAEQLKAKDISDEDRFHLHFALGKAHEDAGHWQKSFIHYDEGNQLRRAALDYDPGLIDEQVRQACIAVTPSFFEERSGGCHADDPIFILGMPRAGSTLIEQILASHSEVEGTQELPDIMMMAQRMAQVDTADMITAHYAKLSALSLDERTMLGEEYIKRTMVHRKTGKKRFIDKMPNNWIYAAFIRLILPNASIIDARRHPMDCGFSNFKQHFARGQSFAYRQEDIGRYYCNYVAMMDTVDAASPGYVHRVIHERLIEDSEAEIRKMLDYLKLPFEESCLNFWQNDRAIQTPSAEQVRRPINKDGMDRWQYFEEWLLPLKTELGSVLASYPESPSTIK